ncbi:hypothetical protein ACET3Z_021639 [Daucus carota]
MTIGIRATDFSVPTNTVTIDFPFTPYASNPSENSNFYYHYTQPPTPPYTCHPLEPPPQAPPYMYHTLEPPPQQPYQFYTTHTPYISTHLSLPDELPKCFSYRAEYQLPLTSYSYNAHPTSSNMSSPFTTQHYQPGATIVQQAETYAPQMFDGIPESYIPPSNSFIDNMSQIEDKIAAIIQTLEKMGKKYESSSKLAVQNIVGGVFEASAENTPSNEKSLKQVCEFSNTLDPVSDVSNMNLSYLSKDEETMNDEGEDSNESQLHKPSANILFGGTFEKEYALVDVSIWDEGKSEGIANEVWKELIDGEICDSTFEANDGESEISGEIVDLNITFDYMRRNESNGGRLAVNNIFVVDDTISSERSDKIVGVERSEVEGGEMGNVECVGDKSCEFVGAERGPIPKPCFDGKLRISGNTVTIDGIGTNSGEKMSNEEDNELETETSGLSFSSSSSSSSSGEDDDEEIEVEEGELDVEEGEINDLIEDEMTAWGDEDDEFGSAMAGPIMSANEVKVLPPVPLVDVMLQPCNVTLSIRVVSSIVGAQVIVDGVEKHGPLNEGSILWITEKRSPLGKVDEIFGPIKNPYYTVRYNSGNDVPTGIQQGERKQFTGVIINLHGQLKYLRARQ